MSETGSGSSPSPPASGSAHSLTETGTSAALWESVRPGPGWRSGRLAIALLATGSLWVGCTAAHVRDVRKMPTGIEREEGVTILLLRDFSLEARVADEKIVGCVSEAIRRAHPTIRIIPPEEFRRTAFPDLDPDAAPKGPDYLALLLGHPVFRERIARLGIRYLILVGGRTEQEHRWGDIECGRGYGGGACLGVVVWDRRSRLAASVLDLQRARAAGEVHAAVSGRPWFAVVGIFPLGLPAFTESRACGDLGEAVARFLAGENLPEP